METSNEDEFNKFVKPPEGAVWNSEATEVHGLTSNLPVILAASEINIVWGEFIEFIVRRIKSDEIQNAMSLFVNHVGKGVLISMQIKFYYYLLNSQLLYLHTIHSSHKYCPEINWGHIQIN